MLDYVEIKERVPNTSYIKIYLVESLGCFCMILPLPKNEELNQLKEYKDKICKFCGRSNPQTILNIQRVLLYHDPFVCVDIYRCQQLRKEQLKQKSHE